VLESEETAEKKGNVCGCGGTRAGTLSDDAGKHELAEWDD